MKFLAFTGLLLATLAAPLAHGEAYKTIVSFSEKYPHCYDYEEYNTTKDWASVTSKVVKGEAFRAFVVRDTREDKTSLPCQIDVAGQIVPAEGLTLADFKWCTMTVVQDATGYQAQLWKKVTVSPGTPAAVSNSVFHTMTVSADEKFDPNAFFEEDIYLYLLLLDTRDSEGTAIEDIAEAPARPCRYALRNCGTVGGSISQGTLVPMVSVGYSDESAETAVERAGLVVTYEVVDEETNATAEVTRNDWLATVPIRSLEVNGDVLSEAELEAYLTPTLLGFSTTAPVAAPAVSLLSATTDSSAAFYLSASSPDLCFYALETKKSLNDAAWKPFNDLLTEKGVDNATQKDYTRCRIDGRSPLTIPVFSGETGRFYRLRMVNQ